MIDHISPSLQSTSNAHQACQAMILAAGRGERMRPLTDHCPKPLLIARGKPLMLWPMLNLARQGFSQQLVNTAWLGEQIEAYFHGQNNEKSMQNVREQLLNSEQPVPHQNWQIEFSHEGRDFGGALETAGGIVRALPRLADVFWVAAGDVFMPDFEFSRAAYERFATSSALAHLWLVENPAHNPRGDFGLSADGMALNQAKDAGHRLYTFSTVALYKREFFSQPRCAIPIGNPQGIQAPLAAMLRHAMDEALVSAEIYDKTWIDVGTPERLEQLNLG